MNIIGRNKEKSDFQHFYEIEQPEFVAVYGRRRVGKTFLIKEFFAEKFTFYVTGLANAEKQAQLENFNVSLNFYAGLPYPQVKTWMEAFRQLIHLLEHSRKRGKKVIFIDEMPWLDTPKSDFLTALEFFWNSWASSRPDILLIACGSATSWMTNKLLKNKGGLYNRVTRRMFIAPFTLGECEAYFAAKKMNYEKKDIAEAYFAFGGIPFYLNLFEKGKSVAQNIDFLCFGENAPLQNEFELLFASLFKHPQIYTQVVDYLSNKKKGQLRDDIGRHTGNKGGGLTATLNELELCGFIKSAASYGKKAKEKIFRLTDPFVLFYYSFMKNNNHLEGDFYLSQINSGRYKNWAGHAFENLCLAHIKQIKTKLGIAAVSTNIVNWRSNTAEIDLMIDRRDNVVNICEIKYYDGEFTIDKAYSQVLQNKRAAFIDKTKTRKAIHTTLITTYGVKHNEYWNNIQSEVAMDDLFKC
ncbi:MAG: ATP-binding protein [Prevotellaceae bacterium]|jgi:AAA+ ATPase superfamily predicted ATPase|nr:ATP-binding protein [Prevotellaceae bacterium]